MIPPGQPVKRKAHKAQNLLRKVFGGTGILPVWVHRLKTCATKV